MSESPPPSRRCHPLAIGLIAGSVAVAALAIFRPRTPAPPVWPAALVATADLGAPTSRMTAPRAAIELSKPPFAAGAGPALRAALDRPLDHFSVDRLAADAAIRQCAEQSGANVAANWPALASIGVDRTQPLALDVRNVPAGQILRLLIDQAGVGAPPRVAIYADADVLRIEPDDENGPHWRGRLVTRLYDVRPLVLDALRWQDLIHDDARSEDREMLAFYGLTQKLEELVDPESWLGSPGGPGGSTDYWSGWLIVRNTPEVQRQVEQYLDALIRNARPAGSGAPPK